MEDLKKFGGKRLCETIKIIIIVVDNYAIRSSASESSANIRFDCKRALRKVIHGDRKCGESQNLPKTPCYWHQNINRKFENLVFQWFGEQNP